MKYLVISFAAIVFAACSSTEERDMTSTEITPPEGLEVVDVNGINVAAASEIDSIHPPEMVFDRAEYDFGSVEEGDIVNHSFTFTNTGESPLIIVDAKASCGCTIPQIPKEPILPGKKGEIKVRFDSKNKPGKITKRVKISANTWPQQLSIIKLKGNVE